MDIEQGFQRLVDRVKVDDAPRQEHRRQLREQVLAQFDAARRSTPTRPPKRRFTMSKPILRWSPVAAAAVVCVAVGLFLAGRAGSVAWADVGKALDKTQAVVLKIGVYQGGDLRQEGELSYLDANRMRMDSNDAIVIADWSTGKLLVLVSRGKQAYLSTITDANQTIQRNWLAALKSIVGNKEAQEIGTKTIGERSVKGWQVANTRGTVTVWADAKTAEMVRVEIQEGVVRTVMSDFRFGDQLDESRFALKVPEGYELAGDERYATTDASSDDLVLLLRAWAGGNGGVFPDSLTDQAGWYRASSRYDWAKEKGDEASLRRAISKAFFRLNAAQSWVYQGKGVKVGDATRAVFWQPIKGGKYLVIYGDLRAQEVDKEHLPAPQATTQPAISGGVRG